MRLIDADELKKKAVWIEERGGFSTLSIEIDDLRHAPTIDAVPVVHGKWEVSEIPYERFRCSVCGGGCWHYDYLENVVKSSYCPNCGAKMDLTDGE